MLVGIDDCGDVSQRVSYSISLNFTRYILPFELPALTSTQPTVT